MLRGPTINASNKLYFALLLTKKTSQRFANSSGSTSFSNSTTNSSINFETTLHAPIRWKGLEHPIIKSYAN